MNNNIPDSLTRKLITLRQPKQKLSTDAVAVASELLRLFLCESLDRASVEAECEQDVLMTDDNSEDTNNHGGGGFSVSEIKAKHIQMVAAEILMDFS